MLASTGELSLPDFFRLHQGIIQVSPENQSYILSLFDGIADELATQDPGFRLMALEKLTRLLVFSLRYFQRSEPELLSDSPIHRRISEIAAYICDHYADAGSLEQVPSILCMSKSYLSRVFKECNRLYRQRIHQCQPHPAGKKDSRRRPRFRSRTLLPPLATRA